MSDIERVSAQQQESTSMGETAQRMEYIVAVGLPKGFAYQDGEEEARGMIRLGGALRAVSVSAYVVWMFCLVPQRSEDLVTHLTDELYETLDPQDCQDALNELFDLNCLARISLGSPFDLDGKILDLIPVPSGFGIGNSLSNLDEFRVVLDGWTGPTELSISLDMIEQVLWFRMDGRLTLFEIIAEVYQSFVEYGAHLEEGDRRVLEDRNQVAIEGILLCLVINLLGYRCLYLDWKTRVQGGYEL